MLQFQLLFDVFFLWLFHSLDQSIITSVSLLCILWFCYLVLFICFLEGYKTKQNIFLLCPTLFFKFAPVLVVKTKIFFKFRNYSLQIPVKLHITTNFLGKIAINFQFFHHVIDKNSYFFHSSLQVSTSNSNDAFLALFLLLMNKKNKNKKQTPEMAI